jgi:hypothetical protein
MGFYLTGQWPPSEEQAEFHIANTASLTATKLFNVPELSLAVQRRADAEDLRRAGVARYAPPAGDSYRVHIVPH